MKKLNSKCDYIEARNENLRDEFFSLLAKGEHSTINELFPQIAGKRARRFYINEERVLLLIRRYHRERKWPARMNARRRKMLQDILRRVEILQAFNPKLSLSDAVYEVVNSEAPSFYLTPRSIRTLLYAYLSA